MKSVKTMDLFSSTQKRMTECQGRILLLFGDLFMSIFRLEKQYWFKCQCVACTENWPTMHEMTQDVLNFR